MGVSVTMETPTGSKQVTSNLPMMSQAGNAYLEFTFQRGAYVYLSAQNSGDIGEVTCKITTGTGTVISENTSSGSYTIATCTGQAP